MAEEHDSDNPREVIDFQYLKSSAFRVLFVEGAWGGLTASGLISMALYSERAPIPKRQSFALKDDGTLGNEVVEAREARKGLIREVETEVLMTVETAESLMKWLAEKVESVKRARGGA